MTQYDSKQILHQPTKVSFFLPPPIFQQGLIAIAVSAVTIAFIHLGLFYIFKRGYMHTAHCEQQKTQRQECMKASYQLTNLLVNLWFGLYGFYVCCIQQHSDHILLFANIFDTSSDVLGHILGYEQYYIFGAMQVGYNLWSLPVGIFYVHESLSMIAHHVAVVVICTLTATSHFGFRLHAPFLLGIFEISSVPLSMMNYLKGHKEWSEKHAKYILQWARITFAILFLTVRILLGTPHAIQCIRGSYAAMMGGGDMEWYLRGWIGLVWAAQVMLLVLQMFWAWLIVKGIGRALMPGKGVDMSAKEKST
jgi:hypothetical protein